MPPLGVRETSTQLRWPRQRNWWVETPLDLSYSEKRWERLFFVTLGTVVARAVTTLDDDFDIRLVGVYAFLPWLTFLLKCQYFDLAAHSCATPGHAMRTSRLRGFLWVLAHLPMIAAMHWLSVAMSQLQVFDADGAHTIVDDDLLRLALVW